jgi:hypothetical protein
MPGGVSEGLPPLLVDPCENGGNFRAGNRSAGSRTDYTGQSHRAQNRLRADRQRDQDSHYPPHYQKNRQSAPSLSELDAVL